jgi:hypothetical protein
MVEVTSALGIDVLVNAAFTVLCRSVTSGDEGSRLGSVDGRQRQGPFL